MRVDLSAQIASFPSECACCSGSAGGEFEAVATRTTGVKVVRTHTRSFSVPYCAACLEHVSTFQSAQSTRKFGFWMLFGGLVVCLLSPIAGLLGVASGVFILIGAISLGRRAESERRTSCACAGPAVEFIGWDGSVKMMDFTSMRYAARFASANAKKIINATPQLREAVAALVVPVAPPALVAPPVPVHPPASRSTSGPAADVVATSSEHDVLLRWVTKIEGLKGPTSRKKALDRALAEVQAQDIRAELRRAALEIEVQAILDKVDALKTVSGKRRALELGIVYAREAGVPDKERDDAIESLERAVEGLTD